MAVIQRFIWDKETQKMIPYAEHAMKQFQAQRAHFVKDDTLLEPIESYATGERLMFDSMSKYKAHLKEHGFEITGGDHLTGRGVQDYKRESQFEKIREVVAEQYNRHEWGMAPISERDRHICQLEREILKSKM